MAEKKFDAGAIQIEDPLDFLSPSEKKAYIRAHQDTLLRSEDEIRRIREATNDVTDPDDGYDGDADGIEYVDYDDEEPVRKPYVYRDTRLHTDERRNRAASAKETNRRTRTREKAAYHAAEDTDDEEVPETAVDYMLSVAMKAFLAAILIVALIIVYMIYVRPLVRRATGLQQQAVSAGATQGENEPSATAEGQNGQEETPRPQAPEDGERVLTTTQLNLRTAPNTETGEVVTTLPAGTELTRLSDDGEWSKVFHNGQELYCASAYLEAE